jgi:UDP-glucose 4-epimerase
VKITLTGGTGFIGSYVVEQLLSEGHELTLFARNPGKVAGQQNRDGIRFVAGELTDRDAARRSLQGADAFIHIARGRGDTASAAISADTLPAALLFEDAVAAGVEQIIYTSSIAVFDDRGQDQFTDASPLRPINIYGATKAAAEAYLLGMSVGSPVRMNAVRPGYTFGNPVVEGASTQGMSELPSIARAASRNEPIEVEENRGLQFIWAGDLAKVYSAVLASDADRAVYTSLSPEFYSWEQVAHWAVELTDSSSEIVVHDTGRPTPRSPWSVESIERDFGLVFNAEAALKDHLLHLADRT